MLKLAAATLFCSAGLALCADIAQGGWCKCRSSCCTPAPTCAAPANCAPAPEGSATADAASVPSPIPPVSGEPSVAAKETRSNRSYSYDPAPSGIVNYGTETTDAAPAGVATPAVAAPTKRRAPASNFFSAGRKAQGIRQ